MVIIPRLITIADSPDFPADLSFSNAKAIAQMTYFNSLQLSTRSFKECPFSESADLKSFLSWELFFSSQRKVFHNAASEAY